ncbi:MAG TPA: TRAFs-binding domain-containing protein [Bryobacteraceae bacterium]|nr:TRAFs-binding domain-containing protein [Bryobacteraceae bacterium]
MSGLPGTVMGLFAQWRARAPGKLDLDTYQSLGKAANENGEALLAFDVSREGLEKWAGDIKLRQVKALALARMGSTELARDELLKIRNEGHDDPETLGLLSRTYKDLWLRSANTHDLRAAFNEYRSAYDQLEKPYWLGINAATLAFALRDGVMSRNLAEEVLLSCETLAAAQPGTQDYWLIATMAEAQLLLDNLPEAERLYGEARKIGTVGNLRSTWGNAQIILRLMPHNRTCIQCAVLPPKVAVFEGRRPGDAEQLAKYLKDAGVGVGYSGAADEAELEFLQAMQSIGGQSHVVLPYNEEQFIKDKIVTDGPGWEVRYRQVRETIQDLIVCSDQKMKFGNIGAAHALDVLRGLAKIHANQLSTEVLPIGKPNPPSGNVEPRVPGFSTERRAMIFADAFHYSHLSEAQVPNFISEVMDLVGQLCRDADPKPEFQNTWGDGLFFVFEKVADAGHFALLLSKTIAGIDRKSAGLPEQLALRIGLHAGPVCRCPDQVTEKENYIGWHVNRAARIEPITPAGKIYASDAFAALATLEAPKEFRFDYVGRIALAKDFGEFPMYELRAADK